MDLPTFRRKQKLKAADLQTLADAVRANRILPGVGIRITGSPNGTTIAVKRTVASSSAPNIHPFQFVSAPWTDTGQPPPDQRRKFKVRPGAVMSHAGAMFAENLNAVFLAPDNTEQFYAWLEAEFDLSSGGDLSVSSLHYGTGTTLPPQTTATDPTFGIFPTKSSIPLFAVKTDNNAVKTVNQFVTGSLSLSMVLTNISCGVAQRHLFWSKL